MTMALLSFKQVWLSPFTIALFVANTSLRRDFRRLNFLNLVSSGTLVLVAWWISTRLASDRWWYHNHSNDLQFFESLAWTSARWGVDEHPGLVGGSFLNYHWLSYAFSGSISFMANLEPYEALAILGPPLLLFFFASLIVSVNLKRNSEKRFSRWLWIFVLLSVMPWVRMDSFSFSIFAALAFLSLVINNQHYDSRSTFVLFVLAMTLCFSKVTTSAVVLIVLIAFAVVQLMRREKVTFLVPAITLTAVLAILTAQLFSSNPAGDQLFLLAPNLEGFLREFLEFWESGNLVAQVCIWILVLTTKPKFARQLISIPAAALMVASLLLVASWIQAGKESAYIGIPALFLLTFIIANGLSLPQEIGPLRILSQISVVGVAALAAFGARPLMRRLNDRTGLGDWLGRDLWGVGLASGVTILILCMSFTLFLVTAVPAFGNSRVRVVFFYLGLSALAGQFIGYSVDNYRRESFVEPSTYEEWSYNSSAFATTELRNVGDWIRRNTNESSILASNNFSFKGDGWWMRIVKNPEKHAMRLTETSWGGANYLLPAETRRRFLIQGPRFQVGYSLPSLDQIERMNVSLEFANRPDEATLRRLKEYGVTGFVVNLNLALERDWSRFAEEKFRSGSFVYLDLK
jgi:hypothetical protein